MKKSESEKRVEKEQKSKLGALRVKEMLQVPNVQNNRLTAINSGIITKHSI